MANNPLTLTARFAANLASVCMIGTQKALDMANQQRAGLDVS
jgi:hypothetical protein